MVVEAKELRRLTKRRRDEWLKHFARHGNMAAACRAVDCHRKSIENLMANNRFFANRVEEARLQAVGRLEEEAFRRAVDGTANYVVSEGRVVRYKGKPLVKREYSDRLLALLLQAHGGDAYKTKTDNVHHHQVDGNEAARKLADALSRKYGLDQGADAESPE